MKPASSQRAAEVLMAEASTVRPTKPAGRGEHSKSSVLRQSRLLDEAYDLFCNLRNSGEAVNPEEFCARYPSIQHSLARLLQAHRFVEDHLELVDVDLLANCPAPGAIFAGFRLERELGRGAFARVFQATELALGHRQVALKISPQGTGTDEAATLGRMIHPNIVPIFSVTEDKESGLTAVCMPYLGQATLLNILDHVYGQPVAEPTAASLLEAIEELPGAQPVMAPSILRDGSYVDGIRWLAIQLAEALAFIHAKGICHRDLKPSNILMRADGTPMLLDFNLAEDIQSPSEHQGGTPSYMSPEHLRALGGIKPGEAARPDTRSDLYSLGVMLYELLTGVHPFGPLPLNVKGSKLVPLLLDRQQAGFRPIRECRPDVDAMLAGVVEKCLAWEPSDRPALAADIARELRRGQRPRARAGRWLLRRRKSVIAASLFLVGMVLTLAFHLATRPPEYIVQLRLGNEACEKNDFSTAIHHFTESLLANPNQPEALFARGKAYVKLVATDGSNLNLASPDFQKADMLTPEGMYKAYFAYCLQSQNQIVPAIELYKQALKHGFQTAEVYNNLAQMFMRRLKFKEAQDNLDEALRINPKLQVAHCNQALLYYRRALRARDFSPEQEGLLIKGIAHFCQAKELGPLPGNVTVIGAALYASASRFHDVWSKAALDHLGIAIEQGIDPRPWPKDKQFAMLLDKPRFHALIRRTPPPGQPARAALLVVEPVSNLAAR